MTRKPGGNNNPYGCKGKDDGINADNISNDSKRNESHGTSIEYTLRRLRKDHPELHEKVLANELSPNAAAIEAGIIKPNDQWSGKPEESIAPIGAFDKPHTPVNPTDFKECQSPHIRHFVSNILGDDLYPKKKPHIGARVEHNTSMKLFTRRRIDALTSKTSNL